MRKLTQVEQKFIDHDWVNDSKWKLYLSNLYPSPSIKNIEKYKKKYYQKNIDSSFDINTDFDQIKEEKPDYSNSQNAYTTINKNKNNVNNANYVNNFKGIQPIIIFFYCIFVLSASIFYFVVLSLNINLYKKMGTFMSLSYLFIFIGLLYLDYKTQKPNFSIMNFFSSEKGQYLSYSIILIFIKDSILIFLPIFLTLLISGYIIYKHIKMSFPAILQKNHYINKAVTWMDNNLLNIYMLRANLEIYNLVFIITCLFFKRSSILNLIIYLHFFKLKYNSTDSYFHACYTKNGEIIRQYLSYPAVPGVFLNVFNKLSNYFKVYLTYRRR